MPHRDIVVIGASAGGLVALTTIVERLPQSLPACVLVVVHTSPDGNDGVLAEILGRSTPLPVSFANDGDRLRPGRVYVSRPDLHLTVTARDLRLIHGPKENGFRPAIDPLFRTAARALGQRVVGVILSGGLDDGTFGLSVIKQHGGLAIVQDPAEAIIPNMPLNAIRQVEVDHVLRAADIAALLERVTAEAVEGGVEMARSKDPEPQQAAESNEVASMEERYGPASGLTCPDCGGALWEINDGGVLRYQCHVGHQYASDSLQVEQRDAVDGALWSAVRVLEEHAELKMRMARRAADGGMRAVSEGFEDGARDAHRQAQQIRQVLFSMVRNGHNGVVVSDEAEESGTVAAAAAVPPPRPAGSKPAGVRVPSRRAVPRKRQS